VILDGTLAKLSRRVSTAPPRNITPNGDVTPRPAKAPLSNTPGPAAGRKPAKAD